MANNGVAGWTKVLTKNGDEEIRNLVGQQVEIWNGEVYLDAMVVTRNTELPTVIITFDNNHMLFCTTDTMFTLSDGSTVAASELKAGSGLRPWSLPNATIDVANVTEVTAGPALGEVYGCVEAVRGLALYQGIQCQA